MRSKQLVALFLCSLVPWTVGNGLIPLLPVYATQLGASSAQAGYYLAFSYLALALGAVSAGWISGSRYRLKLPLIVAGLVGIPAAWLMGRVSSLWGLAALTALIWYLGGLGFALISILAGLTARENERGKVFGILSLTNGLGAAVGGLLAGWLVKSGGYPELFNALAILLTLWPLSASFIEESVPAKPASKTAPAAKTQGLGKNFILLFMAGVVSAISAFFIVLIRSLLMQDLEFNALEISSTGAVGGLVAMPLPLMMGWLSDRRGRKGYLVACYLFILVAILLLAISKQLWNFWVIMILLGIATQGSASLGNALVTDLAPRESLSKGLAIFGASSWIGGVIGFAAAGVLIQTLGFLPTIAIGAFLALGALGLVALTNFRQKPLPHGCARPAEDENKT
jgi:MFS family permease